MKKYETKVIGWGEEALSMLEEDEPMLVIFNQNVPEEVAEICILHEPAELRADPVPGDTLRLGDKEYPIVSIGWEALATLRNLGHCTLMFKDSTEPEMPGCLMLRGAPPTADEIKVGMTISIQ